MGATSDGDISSLLLIDTATLDARGAARRSPQRALAPSCRGGRPPRCGSSPSVGRAVHEVSHPRSCAISPCRSLRPPIRRRMGPRADTPAARLLETYRHPRSGADDLLKLIVTTDSRAAHLLKTYRHPRSEAGDLVEIEGRHHLEAGDLLGSDGGHRAEAGGLTAAFAPPGAVWARN